MVIVRNMIFFLSILGFWTVFPHFYRIRYCNGEIVQYVNVGRRISTEKKKLSYPIHQDLQRQAKDTVFHGHPEI